MHYLAQLLAQDTDVSNLMRFTVTNGFDLTVLSQQAV